MTQTAEPGPGLTWRQRKVLQAIEDYRQQNGYAPTMAEIGKAAGLSSSSSVSYQIRVLAEKGYLEHKQGGSRAVGLTGVPAGPPVPAYTGYRPALGRNPG